MWKRPNIALSDGNSWASGVVWQNFLGITRNILAVLVSGVADIKKPRASLRLAIPPACGCGHCGVYIVPKNVLYERTLCLPPYGWDWGAFYLNCCAAHVIMKGASTKRAAYAYAERTRERLPRRIQELREAAGLTRYALARESGISREYIGRIERGNANPTLPVTAQLGWCMGLTLAELVGGLEDTAQGGVAGRPL